MKHPTRPRTVGAANGRVRGLRRIVFAVPLAAAIGYDPDRAQAAGYIYTVPTARDATDEPAFAPRYYASHEATFRGGGSDEARPYIREAMIDPLAPGPSSDVVETLVAACTGGVVTGVATAEAMAIAAVATSGLALPAVASAAAFGCGISIVSAAARVGSTAVWRSSVR